MGAKERIREEFEKELHLIGLPTSDEKQKKQMIDPSQIFLSVPTSSTMKSVKEEEPAYSKNPPKDDISSRRPRQYNVQLTPPIGENGLRRCSMCSGEVRPQMCGGNKHRWRCVKKGCRKWYGWVRKNDKLPPDLGRKGRHNTLGSPKPIKKVVKRNPPRARKVTEKTDFCPIALSKEAEQAAASLLMHDAGGSSPLREEYYALSEATAQYAESLKKTKPTKSAQPRNPAQKKKSLRKTAAEVQAELLRAVSPLTERERSFRPCAMDKRGRWWISEKRKKDHSPERELSTTMADTAASFRILSHAFRAAAVTRADEAGTVNASVDMMMDALMGCIGPLLSSLSNLPLIRPDPQLIQTLWDASAVHIPQFQ